MTGSRPRNASGAAVMLALLCACHADSPSGSSAVSGGTFPSGDIRLGYTLDLPSGAGPFPAIVFGHGSGRATRDEARGLASRLVAAGFAVLRYVDRVTAPLQPARVGAADLRMRLAGPGAARRR